MIEILVGALAFLFFVVMIIVVNALRKNGKHRKC